MKHRCLLPLLFLLLLLVACGGADAPLASTPLPELAPTAVVTVALPPTAEPSPTLPPTAEPTVATEPTATAEPTATMEPTPLTPATAAFPALVWLPYATGSYGNPLPTLRGEQMGMEPELTPIEHFFDYSPLTGQIAYGRIFWAAAANGTDSVTDLWVYEYATGETTQWLAGGVGRAAWSPIAAENGTVPLAIALHNGQSFDLALITAPDTVEILATNIAPYFAWSPDGRQMAYLDREGHLFTAALPITGMVETLWASGVYANGGWIGDAPVWDLLHDLLIYADEPFTVVNMRTGETIRPTLPADVAPTRPTVLLWSADSRQLVAQEEGMFGNSVRIYQLSEDWQTVTSTTLWEGKLVLGWHTTGVSVVVQDELTQAFEIWPLPTP